MVHKKCLKVMNNVHLIIFRVQCIVLNIHVKQVHTFLVLADRLFQLQRVSMFHVQEAKPQFSFQDVNRRSPGPPDDPSLRRFRGYRFDGQLRSGVRSEGRAGRSLPLCCTLTLITSSALTDHPSFSSHAAIVLPLLALFVPPQRGGCNPT